MTEVCISAEPAGFCNCSSRPPPLPGPPPSCVPEQPITEPPITEPYKTKTPLKTFQPSPTEPPTTEPIHFAVWIGVGAGALIVILIIFWICRKCREDEEKDPPECGDEERMMDYTDSGGLKSPKEKIENGEFNKVVADDGNLTENDLQNSHNTSGDDQGSGKAEIKAETGEPPTKNDSGIDNNDSDSLPSEENKDSEHVTDDENAKPILTTEL